MDTSESRQSHIDRETGLPVRCPVCESPYIVWRNVDWYCPDCFYEGAEALFPSRSSEEANAGPLFHPQRPEQYINLDLAPLEAAFLQRLSVRWQVSPKEAVVMLIKKAAEAEFRHKGENNGTNEVRKSSERGSSEPTTDDQSDNPFREISDREREERRRAKRRPRG